MFLCWWKFWTWFRSIWMELIKSGTKKKYCHYLKWHFCRQRLGEEYRKQCSVVLTQWEADLEKTKAEEEELQILLKEKQKLLQQRRTQQTQHLNTIRKLHLQYMKVSSYKGITFCYDRIFKIFTNILYYFSLPLIIFYSYLCLFLIV